MFVTLVDVWVKPEAVNAFILACEENHLASVQETGNHRFDILQQADDPTHFVLYEAYHSDVEAQAHKQTAHYLKWRETVADMMAAPRQGKVYQGLYPTHCTNT
jgi:autoinducer 2-degrading protein